MSLTSRRNRHPAGPRPFGDMMDDFFRAGFPWSNSLFSDTFRVDLKEEDGHYLVEAEMPGVKKEDIDVQLENGYLTIAVARNEEANEETGDYIHRERRTSSMARTAYLPEAAQEGIQARLENGMLNLTIPKAKQEKRRTSRIEIQ